MNAITLPSRLNVAVTTDLADALRRSAEARGLTVADYARGALQARLLLDGARFALLPDLQRRAQRPTRKGAA